MPRVSQGAVGRHAHKQAELDTIPIGKGENCGRAGACAAVSLPELERHSILDDPAAPHLPFFSGDSSIMPSSSAQSSAFSAATSAATESPSAGTASATGGAMACRQGAARGWLHLKERAYWITPREKPG